jgi:cyclic pyranopterin phosphate synthase
MKNFSHLGSDNKHLGMVDVGHKAASARTATAQALIFIPESLGLLLADKDWQSPKGPVFHTAVIAGTMAAKNTAMLVPLCHNLNISSIKISINLLSNTCVKIISHAQIWAKTGVEMEALVGASVAALTIYDMCKAVSHELVIGETRLVSKTGGKRDYFWTGAGGRQELANERS